MSGKDRSSGKRQRTVEIDVLYLLSYALIVLAGVLCFFGVLGIVKNFLPVTKFEIVGESRFEANELATFAGVARKDILYDIDISKAEENILERCAYIEKVKVKRSFPTKLKFVVREREPRWYLEISGDYYVLDGDLRVLEETKNIDRLILEGVRELTMPSLRRVIVGELLVYGDGQEEIDNTEEIIDTLESSALWEYVTSADLDNRYDIHFELDGAFVANIGSYSKLETKLKYVESALVEAYADGVIGGTVTVSDSGEMVTVKPIYDTQGGEEYQNEAVG